MRVVSSYHVPFSSIVLLADSAHFERGICLESERSRSRGRANRSENLNDATIKRPETPKRIGCASRSVPVNSNLDRPHRRGLLDSLLVDVTWNAWRSPRKLPQAQPTCVIQRFIAHAASIPLGVSLHTPFDNQSIGRPSSKGETLSLSPKQKLCRRQSDVLDAPSSLAVR